MVMKWVMNHFVGWAMMSLQVDTVMMKEMHV